MTNVFEHPANLAAEMQLIGAVLADNRAYDLATDRVPLRGAHFGDAAHVIIWQTIASAIDAGHQAGVVTLKNLLENNENLVHVGGTPYLAQLANVRVGDISLYGMR